MPSAHLAIVFAWIALFISLSVTGTTGWAAHPEWRADRYDCLAHSLLQGHYIDCGGSRETAYRLPGYPVALAGMFVAFGDSEPAVRLFQSVLAALLVFLAVSFTARLGGKVWITGALVLCSWSLYIRASLLQTELVFAFLVTLFVVAFTYRHYATSGLLFGAALLTRGNFLPLSPLLWLLVPRRSLWRFGLPLALLIGGWTARNYGVFGALVPFSTGSGQVWWGANNPVTFGGLSGGWIDPKDLPDWSAFGPLDEVAQDRALTAHALAYLRGVPLPVLLANEGAKLIDWLGLREKVGTQWMFIAGIVIVAGRCYLSLSSWRRRPRPH